MQNNSIGKMYRPMRFLNIKEKQGLEVTNKYKSNYGDVLKFHTEMYVDELGVTVEFIDLEIPVVFKENGGEELPVSSEIISVQRPINISSKDSLIAEYPIVKDAEIYDLLEIEMIPALVNTEALKEKYNLQGVDCDEAMLVHVKTKKMKVSVHSASVVVAL